MSGLLGTGQRRIDGQAKVRGKARYGDDQQLPNLAHARLVLSPHAAARVVYVETATAAGSPGVLAVVSGKELTADVSLPALFPMAADQVVYSGQPVAVVVAESEAAAADAAALVDVQYEARQAVVDPLFALEQGAPSVLGAGGDSNLTDSDLLELGDVDSALAGSEVVVGGRYELPCVNQAFLEPHVATGEYDDAEGFRVWTPTQSLFVTQLLTAAALGEPADRVRVLPTAVGGGFGGKLGVLLEPLVAWLARSIRRPVRLTLTRTEEFLMGGHATGCVIDLELGGSRDGRLLALSGRVVVDQGSGQGYPARRVAEFLARPYRIPAYRIECRGTRTNKAPVNAYRGQPGALGCFALESAIDELAGRLQLDAFDLRLGNLRQEGDPDPAGGVWPRVALAECLRAARDLAIAGSPAAPGQGLGLALGVWDGYQGGAAAGCRLNPDGSLTLHVGTVDITGTHTTLAMIAADALGIPLERVRVELGDSGSAPNSVAAGGSATTYVLGRAVAEAAADARRQLLDVAAEELEAAVDDLELAAGEVRVKGVPQRSRSVAALAAAIAGPHTRYPPVHGHGRAVVTAPSPMAAVHLARVRVDQLTGAWHVLDYAAVHDVGRALNPAEIEAQIHGGVLQGLGRASGEELAYRVDGASTASFMDYELPSIDASPPFNVLLVEVPSQLGSLGVRGVGEPPIVPVAPTIGNAIAAATGARLRRLPFTAQQLHAQMSMPALEERLDQPGTVTSSGES